MWIPIFVGYILSILLPPQAGPPIQRIDIHWVYVNDDLRWQPPPKGTTAGVKYCDNALLAVLFPSGEYAGVSPVLYRHAKTKHISVSRGDGMVIRRGHWSKLSDGSIRIISSVVYTPLPEAGKHYPSDEREEVWKPAGMADHRIAKTLKTPRLTLVPLHDFTDLDFLANYIAVEGSGQPRPRGQGPSNFP